MDHVAQVARVAQVAQVAQVQQAAFAPPLARALATPGKSAATAVAARTSSAAKVAAQPATASALVAGSATDSGADRRDRRRDSNAGAQAGGAVAQSKSPGETTLATAPAPMTPVSTGPSSVVGTTATIAQTGPAARAAAILALQDARDAQPVSHMTLQLDNGDGGLDRIRVALRGTAVGAAMDLDDPSVATEVAANIHQLAAALQSRGLDPDSLRVRSTGAVTAPQAVDLARALAAGGDVTSPSLGTLFAQATASSSRSRGDAQGQRPQQDPSRQRARKDQQGDQQ